MPEPKTTPTPTQTPAAAPAPATASVTQPLNGLALASMLVGIGSIIFTFAGLIPGIIAIVLGVMAKKKGDNGKGMATAGIICGAIGAVLSALLIILWIVILVFGASSGSYRSTY